MKIPVTTTTMICAAFVADRLARRGRQRDGSIATRVKRNDAFSDLRADHVIETTGAPKAAVLGGWPSHRRAL